MDKGPSTWGEYWTSEESEENHFKDHGDEMGFKTIEEYANASKVFVQSKERGIKSFKSRNGSTYKYNPRTNEFIILTKTGKIVTYYLLSGKSKAFWNLFEQEGGILK